MATAAPPNTGDEISRDVIDFVIRKSVSKWKDLARSLPIASNLAECEQAIKQIENAHPGDLKEQCNAMLVKYTESTDATVGHLAQCLQKIGQNRSAQDIVNIKEYKSKRRNIGTDTPDPCILIIAENLEDQNSPFALISKQIINMLAKKVDPALQILATVTHEDLNQSTPYCGQVRVVYPVKGTSQIDLGPQGKLRDFFGTYYLPKMMDRKPKYIIAHSPLIAQAAFNIKVCFPSSKVIIINHCIPSEVHIWLEGQSEGLPTEDEMIRWAQNADTVVSVGKKVHDYFSQKLDNSKHHHLFLPVNLDSHSCNLCNPESCRPQFESMYAVSCRSNRDIPEPIASAMEMLAKESPSTRWDVYIKPDLHGDGKSQTTCYRIKPTPESESELQSCICRSSFYIDSGESDKLWLRGFDAICHSVPFCTTKDSHLAASLYALLEYPDDYFVKASDEPTSWREKINEHPNIKRRVKDLRRLIDRKAYLYNASLITTSVDHMTLIVKPLSKLEAEFSKHVTNKVALECVQWDPHEDDPGTCPLCGQFQLEVIDQERKIKLLIVEPHKSIRFALTASDCDSLDTFYQFIQTGEFKLNLKKWLVSVAEEWMKDNKVLADDIGLEAYIDETDYQQYRATLGTEAKPDTSPETKPDTTPETKPDASPEAKPDISPERKEDTSPEAKPDTSPETKPDTSPETKPDTTPETKPDISPERKQDTSPVTKPDTSLVTKPDTSPKTKPDISPETKPDASPENKQDTSPETKPDTSPETKPDTSLETKPDTSPETKPDTSPETKPDTSPETKPDTSPETKPDTSPETKPGTSPETKPDTSPETKPDTSPETKPDTSPETKPGTSPETKPDTGPQTKPDTSPKTKPDTSPETKPDNGLETKPESSTLGPAEIGLPIFQQIITPRGIKAKEYYLGDEISRDVIERVIRTSASKWKDLARRLPIASTIAECERVTKQIENAHQGDTKEQCNAMLVKWCTENTGANVGHLAQCLQKIGQNRSAENIVTMKENKSERRNMGIVHQNQAVSNFDPAAKKTMLESKLKYWIVVAFVVFMIIFLVMTNGIPDPPNEILQQCDSTSCDTITDEYTVKRKGDLRLLLIGKTGTGKSSTGNLILQKRLFNTKSSAGSVTKETQSGHRQVNDRDVLVINTPVFMNNHMPDHEITHQVARSLTIATPGIHIILLVISISERFTRADMDTVKYFHDMFGDRLFDYLVVVFTHYDQLSKENRSLDDWVGDVEDIKELLVKCKNRNVTIATYEDPVVYQNKSIELISLMDEIVEDNKEEPYYTGDIYAEAKATFDRLLEKERKQIQDEKEEIKRIRLEEEFKFRNQLDNLQREREEKYKTELELLRTELMKIKAEKDVTVDETPPPHIFIPSDSEISQEARKYTENHGIIVKWGRNIYFQKHFGWYIWKERWECTVTDSQSQMSAKVLREYRDSTEALGAALKKLFVELHVKYNQ